MSHLNGAPFRERESAAPLPIVEEEWVYEDEEEEGEDDGSCPPYELVSEEARLVELLPLLVAAPVVGLDCETGGTEEERVDPLRAKLCLIQLAMPDFVVLVEARVFPRSVLVLLAPILSADHLLVTHNGSFDYQVLVAQAGLPWPTAKLFDTKIAYQLLHAGTAAGLLENSTLESAAADALGIAVDKSEQTSDWAAPVLRRRQLTYAARDAHILIALQDALAAQIVAAQLERVTALEMACVLPMAKMELDGCPLDPVRWLALVEVEREARKDAARTLQDLSCPHGGPPINWASPDHVRRTLQTRGKLHGNSTERKALIKIATKEKLVVPLLAFRTASTRIQRYGARWLAEHLHPLDGRVHASFAQLGTVTGRMSCSSPNLQNLPKVAAYRACVRPPAGRVIVSGDFSQVELRIAATLSRDERMIAVYRADGDMHTDAAAALLGIDPGAVTKAQRNSVKPLNFGILYAMGAASLQTVALVQYGLVISLAEARRQIETFLTTYAGFRTWSEGVQRELARREHLDIRTLTGRRQRGVEAYPAALNSPIQGSAGDVFKAALAALWDHRDDAPDVHLIAVVHDEFITECDSTTSARTAAWLQYHMEAAQAAIMGDLVPPKAEITIGRDWSGAALEVSSEDAAGAADVRGEGA